MDKTVLGKKQIQYYFSIDYSFLVVSYSGNYNFLGRELAFPKQETRVSCLGNYKQIVCHQKTPSDSYKKSSRTGLNVSIRTPASTHSQPCKTPGFI